MERFAVTSDSFSLIEAFKKEAEKIGYKYDRGFNEFSEDVFFSCRVLFFSNKFNRLMNTPAFSLSNHDGEVRQFELPNEWGDALRLAKDNFTNVKTIELNDEYNADINYSSKTVVVGCQKFSFAKIKELAELLNQGEGFERSVATEDQSR